MGRVLERVSLQTYEALLSGVDQVARAQLDALLIPEPGTRVSRRSGKPSARAMLALLERIDFLHDLRIDFAGPGLQAVHRNRLKALVREGKPLAPYHFMVLEPNRKRATLLATLLERCQTLTDREMEMHDALCIRLQARAMAIRDQQLIDSGRAINAQVTLFARVGSALIEARQNEEDPFKKLERVVPWERFVQCVLDACRLA